MDTRKRGVVYVATGEKCYDEAVRSAGSVRKHNPTVPITIITDANRGSSAFDEHLLIEAPLFRSGDKVKNISRSPYELTLFLDSDTFVTGDISEYFSILDHFDFAAAHCVARGYWYFPALHELGVPESFAELNSGVFSFRKNEQTGELLRAWLTYYEQDCATARFAYLGRLWDQPSLRRALWEHPSIRLCVLPTEFNALRNWGTSLWGRARLIHGRGNVERVAREMNEFSNVERVYLQQFGMIPRVDRIPVWTSFRVWLRFNAAFVLMLLRRIGPGRRKR